MHTLSFVQNCHRFQGTLVSKRRPRSSGGTITFCDRTPPHSRNAQSFLLYRLYEIDGKRIVNAFLNAEDASRLSSPEHIVVRLEDLPSHGIDPKSPDAWGVVEFGTRPKRTSGQSPEPLSIRHFPPTIVPLKQPS